MSRKPPKLFPIEGKASSSPAEKKGSAISECMPPLKQASNVGLKPAAAPSSLSSGPSLRRSGLTRHFLNCNGSSSSESTRRRFLQKLPMPSSAASALHSNISSKSYPDGDSTSTSNGCGTKELPITTPNKVNGTITNGINSKPSEPTKQLLKRTKSLGGDTGDGEESSSSDSQQNSGITFTNERKVENSNSRKSVSANNSQNVNIVKRTSRFSQNSNVVPSKLSTPTTSLSSPSPSTVETMPALVPYNTSLVRQDALSSDDTEPVLDNQEATKPSLEEPKIIRKGDTVIKSYVDEKTGRIAVFEKEMKLEVCDFGSGKWYPAKVKNIDWSEQNVLVHYSNWSSRYDEWISMQSNRLRPCKSTNVIRFQFAVDERVEALWTVTNEKFPATVTQVFPTDLYEVLFDDGFKMKRNSNQLFKLSHSEPPSPPSLAAEVPPETTMTQPDPKSVEEPSEKIGVRRRKTRALKERSKKATTPEKPLPLPTVTEPSDSAHPSSRPAHFSVFDLPQGDLGKRRRTVHDYSVLVRGRTPVVKGPRRPKSEGTSTAIETSNVTSDDAATEDEAPRPESPSKPDITKESIEPSTTDPPPLSRRRKSGTATHVPTVKPSSLEWPKELPVIEEPVTETVPPPADHVESTTKKRKHPMPSSVTPSNAVTVDTKTLVKPETAQLSSEVAPIVSTVTTTSSVNTSRRGKSLGVMPLSSVPTVVHADVPKDNDTKVDSGFADESGNAIIIEQNSEDGFWKCPLNNCGKNFRKDSLLKMHLKHYHPELKVTRGIANVVQMAQARTAFENEHPSDHHTWQKLPSMDQPPAVDSSAAETCLNSSAAAHVSDALITPKRISKSVNHSKENSPEKVLPTFSHKSESGPSTVIPDSVGAPRDPSQALSESSRLRLSRRRNFVVNKLGRIRANNRLLTNNVASHRKRNHNVEGSARTVIATDSSKKSKILGSVDKSTTSITEVIDEQSAPSLSKLEKRVNQQGSFESCTGSSGSEPYVVLSSCEPDITSLDTSRPPRGRWNKSHVRRSLLNSNRRRVGSNKLPNSTSFFLKKRIQMRKFIGKRRQKRTSILSRISSGRMRVILEALNQRSMRRRRFRADRRYRDVKVDVINCICNSKTEFGLMIQCELCLCWQHGSCFNVQSNSQLPEYYACQSCSEPDRARLSKKYEWAESEFYKLGKLPAFPFAPRFSTEDARTMKTCTNLTANLVEAYSMIKGLKLKDKICFGEPEQPQLYQWNTERIPPQEELQRDRFDKYFQPVLRRLMLENKSDGTYSLKLKKLAEARMKLKKYSDAVESVRLTMKKKLGCRAATYLHYICDSILDDMIKAKRRSISEDATTGLKKETMEGRRRTSAEQAYHRLAKLREELFKHQCKDRVNLGINEQRLYSHENGIGPSVSSASFVSSSPFKSEFSSYSTSFARSAPLKYLPNVNLILSAKGGVPSASSNGLKKDLAASVRDFCMLKRYLKERRSIGSNIASTLIRMSKQFPDEWKNLTKTAKQFVKQTKKETTEGEKFKWISSVIVTYNTLRILLRNIYSESNAQNQRNFCIEFEDSITKLFELFGIGSAEVRLEGRKVSIFKHQIKDTKGIETLDMIGAATSDASVLSSETTCEADEARKNNLKPLSLTSKVVEDVLMSPSESKREDDIEAFGSSLNAAPSEIGNKSTTSTTSNNDNLPCPTLYYGCRRLDGSLVSDFSGKAQLLEAAVIAAGIPAEECTEENATLIFPDDNSESIRLPLHSGITPVPAASRITSEVCKKNLAHDILLQQQQVDLYLDKIEAQIIKLSSQSRQCSTVNSMKPSEMSEQRDKMLQAMDLVSRLSKTLVGENDSVEHMDISEATMTDSSDMDSSSESDDGDNTSNYSGTDTETADEGDKELMTAEMLY